MRVGIYYFFIPFSLSEFSIEINKKKTNSADCLAGCWFIELAGDYCVQRIIIIVLNNHMVLVLLNRLRFRMESNFSISFFSFFHYAPRNGAAAAVKFNQG